MPVLPALYSGVPTVSVDGVSNALLESSVTSMIIEDANDGLATCEIAFQNAGATDAGVGFPLIDEQLIDFGSELRLEAGGGDAYGSIFDGTVTGLEVGFHQHDTARLTVLGADRFQELRRRRRTRVFEDMTDAEIIGVVGREHGLTVDVVGGDVEHRALAQFDQSDLAFIRERARRIGVGRQQQSGERPRIVGVGRRCWHSGRRLRSGRRRLTEPGHRASGRRRRRRAECCFGLQSCRVRR